MVSSGTVLIRIISAPQATHRIGYPSTGGFTSAHCRFVRLRFSRNTPAHAAEAQPSNAEIVTGFEPLRSL
jgi:hypothetical protein